jgi:hypothetical protein
MQDYLVQNSVKWVVLVGFESFDRSIVSWCPRILFIYYISDRFSVWLHAAALNLIWRRKDNLKWRWDHS